MEDERKIELEILKNCIKNLNDFMKNSVECENVMPEEYDKIGNILNDLIDRRIELEINIEELSYEEI